MDQNAPMQIILVRHGETALNAARVLQPPDTPLSALGLQQAGAVARRLAGDGVAGIVSSDLARARQTAEAIAGRCQNLKVVLSPAFRERDFGDWRGLHYDSLPADALHTEAAPPGGESAADFAARCRQAPANAGSGWATPRSRRWTPRHRTPCACSTAPGTWPPGCRRARAASRAAEAR